MSAPKHSDRSDARKKWNAQQKWNARYRNRTSPAAAAPVLADNRHLLPNSGRALDLACGLGGNALLLAQHGLETHAWDISDIAVERVQQQAHQQGLSLQAHVRDVTQNRPAPESFDVIVVSRFLERDLAPALIEALTSNGLLFYQTFIQQTDEPYGPQTPMYRLAEQELLSLFAPLRVVVYREEAQIGDLTQGWRNEAQLIGQKRIPA